MAWSALALLLISFGTIMNGAFLHSTKLDTVLSNYQTTISHQDSKTRTQLEQPNIQYTRAANTNVDQPTVNLNAKAYVVYDRTSAKILLARSADDQLPIASLTKLMTVLVILQNHKANEKVVIPNLPKLDSDVAIAGIKEGQTYTVAELVSAVLVASSADAAQALAIWDSKTEAAFVAKMNDTAQRWDLDHTHYTNVVGLDDPQNYSSAKDLIKIVSILLQSKTIAATVDKKSVTIASEDQPSKTLYTTNALLGQSGIAGFKTGTTALAGQCFIGRYFGQNRDVITVVLGSTNRFGDTQNMLNYSFKSVSWM